MPIIGSSRIVRSNTDQSLKVVTWLPCCERRKRWRRLSYHLTFSYSWPALLFRYGVAYVVHHLFDLRQRDLLRIIFNLHCLVRNIYCDSFHAVHLANSPFNGVLAMLTSNVGCDKGCRFHRVCSFICITCNSLTDSLQWYTTGSTPQ